LNVFMDSETVSSFNGEVDAYLLYLKIIHTGNRFGGLILTGDTCPNLSLEFDVLYQYITKQ